MFELYAEKNKLIVLEKETVTSGSVNVYPVRFEFSADWDGLKKTAVFQAGCAEKAVPLTGGACTVPAEVLEAGLFLMAGVCGMSGKTVVLPTVWATLGLIQEGAVPGDTPTPDPPPEDWEEALEGKGDNLALDGQTLALRSGETVLSEVELPGSGDVAAYLVRAPIGTITVWSGSVDSIPDGWALCDGQDGRPDLRGKVVLGAGGVYNPGAAGTIATDGDLAYSAQCYIIKVTADPADGGSGEKGDPGATFTPSVSEEGVISWTNDGDLPNPEPVDIKGPPGKKGAPGQGVPAGGAAGQVLAKKSATDYDTQWVDQTGGGASADAGDGLSKDGDTLNVDNPVRGIMTQAEFDALTEAQKASGTYFVDDGQNGGSGGEVYDNQERVIGTWFGKPLYRKIFSVVFPGSDSLWAPLASAPPNIDILAKIYGVAYGKNGYTAPLPQSLQGYNITIVLYEKTEIQLTNSNPSFYGASAYIVIEYTKTTDSEVSA